MSNKPTDSAAATTRGVSASSGKASFFPELAAAPGSGSQGLSRALIRWLRVFWPLILLLALGVSVFSSAIRDSIASTPHPELVYGIFLVAAVTAIILAYLQHVFVSEHGFLEMLQGSPAATRTQLIKRHDGDSSVGGIYDLMIQTRGLSLRDRQSALENEFIGVENQLLARLALPNFLAGSLVGLGLVGTFIGLLGTLHDLAGVFSAMSTSGTSDTATMFTQMIESLKGPMQGMGTAFVASLYGLLGSLVMGLISSSVRRTGERMLGDLRVFVNEDVYANTQRGSDAPASTATTEGAVGVDSTAIVAGLQQLGLSQERAQTDLKALMERLIEAVQTKQAETDAREQSIQGLSQSNAALQVAISDLSNEIHSMSKKQDAAVNEQNFLRLTQSNAALEASLKELRSEIRAMSGKHVFLLGKTAVTLLVLAIVAALAVVLTLALHRPAPMPAAMASAPVSERSESPKAPAAVVTPTAPAPVAEPIAAPAAAAKPTNSSSSPSSQTATVARGDSLWKIASSHGITLEQLLAANPNLKPNGLLQPGQDIKLP